MFGKKISLLPVSNFLTFAAILCFAVQTATAQFSGVELLRVTRVAQGGSEYAGLNYVTAKSQGFINVAPFAAVGLGTGSPTAAVEVQFNITDYQTKGVRRRLEVLPAGIVVGQTYLVYDGSMGGGMFQGNRFRVTETAASRQWAMMGFDTLNQAADGQLPVTRQDDRSENGIRYYVVDVKFSSSDTVQYCISDNV